MEIASLDGPQMRECIYSSRGITERGSEGTGGIGALHSSRGTGDGIDETLHRGRCEDFLGIARNNRSLVYI